MKLALHRSLTFWSGILVMGFICWAWWDSERFSSACSRGRLLLDNQHSSIFVGLSTGAYSKRPWMTRETVPDYKREVFPAPFLMRGKNDTRPSMPPPGVTKRDFALMVVAAMPADYRFALIPHWLFLLFATVPWSGLLLWRARRRKRSLPVIP